MGAYKYMQELDRKKQSDALRFILRVRTWHLRQLNSIHRAPRPTRPEKARRLGYRAKQGKSPCSYFPETSKGKPRECLYCVVFFFSGYVIYRVRIRRGGRRRKAHKGQVYGKPVNHGVTQLKNQRSVQAVAEVRFLSICSCSSQ